MEAEVLRKDAEVVRKDAEILRKDAEVVRMRYRFTDAVQHHAIPHLLSQRELPVELQLDGVVRPHLVDRENNIHHHDNIITPEQTETDIQENKPRDNNKHTDTSPTDIQTSRQVNRQMYRPVNRQTDLDILVLLQVGSLHSELTGLGVEVDGLHTHGECGSDPGAAHAARRRLRLHLPGGAQRSCC